jgi:adenylate cyclase
MLRFLLLGIALCAALIAPSIIPDFFQPINFALDDWRTRFAIKPHQETRIVVVDVDERSLAEQGPWPWSRATVAYLLETLLTTYQVSSIAIDMVFPEARPDDALLARQMQRPAVTGAVVFDLDLRNLPILKTALPSASGLQAAPGAPLITGVPVVANYAALMPSHVGHITPVFDQDGAVRRLPPVVCEANQPASCRPILTLAAFMTMLNDPQLALQPGRGFLAPAWQLSVAERSGAIVATVPITPDGMVQVPYRHIKKNWLSVSATDVLNHKVPPALFKGVMVLVGGTALGLGDSITTPVNPLAAGLEPHVEMLSALLDDDFQVVPRWGSALDGLLMLPFAAVLWWSLRRYVLPIQRAILFPLWLMLTITCFAITSTLLLQLARLSIPLTPLVLFPPIALLLTLLAELYRAASERAGIFDLLSVYLPQQVASRLVTFGWGRTQKHNIVDASRREITVLFADIHGFAGLSENQSPEVVARLMQRVFTEMAEAVVAQGGTIDKFIGDAIMAFWNAPQDDPDHASHALATAHDILHRIKGLSRFCAELGLAPIQVGIGLETGQALVGNFGSAHRRTFTALGDPVVLASRLEALTRSQQQPLLIGQGCAAALNMNQLQALGPVIIRGRLQPVNLYAPMR